MGPWPLQGLPSCLLRTVSRTPQAMQALMPAPETTKWSLCSRNRST